MQSPPVSKQAVSKRVASLVRAGRLATKPGPRNAVLINIVAFNRAVAEETDPAQALRNNRPPIDLLANAYDEGGEGDDEPVRGGGVESASYHSSRAKREAYQAENARLNLAERLEELVSREAVEQRTMEIFRHVRDRLLMLPTRSSERLAAAPDARAVKAILTAEIRRLLETLADELDHLGDSEDRDDDDSFDDGDPVVERPEDLEQ